jgi:hypothetical protein
MQNWFYRLSPAARALMTGVFSAVAIFGVLTVYDVAEWSSASHSVAARLVVSTIAGLLSGVLGVMAGDRRARRIYGSTEQAITYMQALRTGRLPAAIDPGAWRRWLDASRQSLKWAMVGVGVFAVLAGLQSLERQWAVVSLLTVVAFWQLAATLMQRHRISRLATAVDGRAG